MTSLPRNRRKSTTLSNTMTLTRFLMIRLNASRAEEQKLVL